MVSSLFNIAFHLSILDALASIMVSENQILKWEKEHTFELEQNSISQQKSVFG